MFSPLRTGNNSVGPEVSGNQLRKSLNLAQRLAWVAQSETRQCIDLQIPFRMLVQAKIICLNNLHTLRCDSAVSKDELWLISQKKMFTSAGIYSKGCLNATNFLNDLL